MKPSPCIISSIPIHGFRFKRIEEPILNANPNVQITWHVRPKYDYWRTVAQREEEKEIRLAFNQAAKSNDASHDWARAAHFFDQASDSLGLAFEASNQAMKTSLLEEAVVLWHEAMIKARTTQELWSQAATVFEQAKDTVPEMLKTHLPRLLKHLNEERISWLAEIKWRELRHQAAIADGQQERIATLLATDNESSLKATLNDTDPVMASCEEAAEEWKKSEDAIATTGTSGEAAAQKEKEYNNLNTTVAFNRSKIGFSRAAAEVMTAWNKASTAIGEKEKEKRSNELRERIEDYCDAIERYQQFLQHVENHAPAEWNSTRGWHAVATDWEKNKKEVETAQRKMVLKITEFSAQSKKDQADRHNEADQADDDIEGGRLNLRNQQRQAEVDEATKWADFLKKFQEDNQPLIHQFSKEINKLVLDMAAGKKLPEMTVSADATLHDVL